MLNFYSEDFGPRLSPSRRTLSLTLSKDLHSCYSLVTHSDPASILDVLCTRPHTGTGVMAKAGHILTGVECPESG